MTFDIAAFAVRRWQFTLVAFALLTLLGVNALVSTPRSEDPHFPIPTMVVRAVLPGAEPSELEQLVADPVEDALSGLYSPLAIAIMGGLVTSTLLSRIATPVTYWLLSRGEVEDGRSVSAGVNPSA